MKWWLAGLFVLTSACNKGHVKSDEDLYATSRTGGDRGPSAQQVKGDDASRPAAWPAHLERWSELTHQLGRDLGSAGSCTEVAKTMRAFTTKNGSELSSLQRQLVDWEKTAPEKDVYRFYKTVQADMNVRIDAGIRCKDDATARSAFDQFFKVAGLDLR